MALFVQDMTLRPSCYQCRMRSGRTSADITLADLWNVSEAAPEFDDDKGVSAIFLNTEAGSAVMQGLNGRLKTTAVGCEAAKGDNGGFSDPSVVPERREEFFKGVHSADDLIGYMKGFIVRRPLHQRMYRKIRSFLSAIKRRISG